MPASLSTLFVFLPERLCFRQFCYSLFKRRPPRRQPRCLPRFYCCIHSLCTLPAAYPRSCFFLFLFFHCCCYCDCSIVFASHISCTMSLRSLVLADPDLFERNIVFVPTTTFASSSSYSTSPVTSITAAPTSTTQLPLSSTTSTASNSTVYRLDIPATNTGSSNLKYLYLFFLLLGLIILGIIARVVIVKRRRARELEKRAVNRNEALRLDLENRVSDEHAPATAPRTGYTFPLFNINLFRNPPRQTTERDELAGREMEESSNPPPPYPTHVKPAYIRDPRLPVYQEVSDEDEEDEDRALYEQESNLSQRELRRPSSSGHEEEQSILSVAPRPATGHGITNNSTLETNPNHVPQTQPEDTTAPGPSSSGH